MEQCQNLVTALISSVYCVIPVDSCKEAVLGHVGTYSPKAHKE